MWLIKNFKKAQALDPSAIVNEQIKLIVGQG
jgi:hypothetical protein